MARASRGGVQPPPPQASSSQLTRHLPRGRNIKTLPKNMGCHIWMPCPDHGEAICPTCPECRLTRIALLNPKPSTTGRCLAPLHPPGNRWTRSCNSTILGCDLQRTCAPDPVTTQTTRGMRERGTSCWTSVMVKGACTLSSWPEGVPMCEHHAVMWELLNLSTPWPRGLIFGRSKHVTRRRANSATPNWDISQMSRRLPVKEANKWERRGHTRHFNQRFQHCVP